MAGARVRGEFGDTAGRYTNAKPRRNYAGTSHITRASGKKLVALARYARNKRLADALFQQPSPRSPHPPVPRLLRQPASPRNRPQRRPATPVPPPRRHSARLPAPRHRLRRSHRLAHTQTRSTRNCLTTHTRGMSKPRVAGSNPAGGTGLEPKLILSCQIVMRSVVRDSNQESPKSH